MIEARHSAKTYVKENIKRVGTSWHLPMPELAAYPGAVPLMIGKDPMKPAFRAPLYLQELLYEFNLEVARRQKEEPALTADAGAEPGAMTGLKDRVKRPAGHLTARRGAILCTMLSEHVPDLSTFSESGLFSLYRAILSELKSRGVIRTENAPVGDYAEYLVATALSGQLAPNSEKSWDVLGSDGEKLQVKARVVAEPAEPGQFQLSPFR